MIKVCGLSRLIDIEYVNKLKPDYIGFVFTKSKREVTKEVAKTLKSALRDDIKTVGIFVNEDVSKVVEVSEAVELDVIQLHGDEDSNYIKCLRDKLSAQHMSLEVWKAIRVRDESSLENISDLDVDGLLLDTYSANAYGGVGECFNWNLVSGIKLDKKVILAGGIDKDNVLEARNIVEPDIIDVSSGVETDGVKDYEKIREFLEKGRL